MSRLYILDIFVTAFVNIYSYYKVVLLLYYTDGFLCLFFHLTFTFSICMNLGEAVNHCGFEGVFLGGCVSV